MQFFGLFLFGLVCFYAFLFLPVLVCIGVLSFFTVFLVRRRYLLIPVVVMGFAYGACRYEPPLDLAAIGQGALLLECSSTTEPRQPASGKFVQIMTVSSARAPDTGEPLKGFINREVSILSDEPMTTRTRYEIAVTMSGDSGRRNPGAVGEWRPQGYLDAILDSEPVETHQVYAWFLKKREQLSGIFRDRFSPDTGALLAALTIGERTEMSEDLRNAFSRTGLAHVLSISGTHFGLFSTLIFGLTRTVIRVAPYKLLQKITIYLSPSQAAALVSAPCVLAYLLLSGFSVPAVRSFIMITVFLVGLLVGRKGFWLNTTLFAAFIICALDPSALLSISFQLSFLAVLSMGYFLGDRERNPEQGSSLTRLKKMFAGALVLTLTVTIGTAPLVAHYFHYAALISPLANLLITPLIGFVLVPLSLLAAFIYIVWGVYPFEYPLARITDMAIGGVELLASFHFADIKVPAFPLILPVVFYAGAFLILAKTVYLQGGEEQRGSRQKVHAMAVMALSVVVICLVPRFAKEKELSVTYLDVGQGDAAVIETGDGKTVVIDTGKTGKELAAYLRYRGITTIDALAVTHADVDHAGGVGHILQQFAVKELWDSGLIEYPPDLKMPALHRSLERGDEVEGGGIVMQILHPYEGFYTSNDEETYGVNNDSLVVRVTGLRSSFLFASDVTEEAEEDIAHLHPWLRSDVLKVPHHGSRTSSSEAFLAAVSPTVGIISVGRYNSYGHPHGETLRRLQDVRLFRTDRDGAVKITEQPDGIAAKTYRELQFERARNRAAEWRNIRRLFTVW